MSVIIRLQNLPWSANALDIRGFFRGLNIPEGGVHIVGGEMGDAFIAFSTDEDARQAMMMDCGKLKEIQVRLLLSSRAEMQKVIETARQVSVQYAALSKSSAISSTPSSAHVITPNQIQPPVITSNLTSLLSKQIGDAQNSNMGLKLEGNTLTNQSLIQLQQQQLKLNALLMNDNTSIDKRDDRSSSERDRKRDPDRRDRNYRSPRSRSRERSRRSRSRSRSRDRLGRIRRRRSRSRERRSKRRRSSSRERSRERNRDVKRELPNPWAINPNPASINLIANEMPKMQNLEDLRNPIAFPGNTGLLLPDNAPLFTTSSSLNKPIIVTNNCIASLDEQRTSPNDKGDGRCVKISKMDRITGYGEIRRFFAGLQIHQNGIKMINDKSGRRTGVAYIRFARLEFKRMALLKSGLSLRDAKVEINPLSDEDFDDAVDSFKPRYEHYRRGGSYRSDDDDDDRDSDDDYYRKDRDRSRSRSRERERVRSNHREDSDDDDLQIISNTSRDNSNDEDDVKVVSDSSNDTFTTLLIKDIPPFTKEQDIIKMFSNYTLVHILICKNVDGTKANYAYAKFHRAEDAKSALNDKTCHLIAYRNVTVSSVSDDIYDKDKNEINSDINLLESELQSSTAKQKTNIIVPNNSIIKEEPNVDNENTEKSIGKDKINYPVDPRLQKAAAATTTTTTTTSQNSYLMNQFDNSCNNVWGQNANQAATSSVWQMNMGNGGNSFMNANSNDSSVYQHQPRKDPRLSRFDNPNAASTQPVQPWSNAPDMSSLNNFTNILSNNNNNVPLIRDPRQRNMGTNLYNNSNASTADENPYLSNAQNFTLQSNSTNYVILSNLEPKMLERDIIDFFSDVGLIPHRVHTSVNQSGDCFCEFGTPEEARRALAKNNYNLGMNSVKIDLIASEKVEDRLLALKSDLLGMRNDPRINNYNNHNSNNNNNNNNNSNSSNSNNSNNYRDRDRGNDNFRDRNSNNSNNYRNNNNHNNNNFRGGNNNNNNNNMGGRGFRNNNLMNRMNNNNNNNNPFNNNGNNSNSKPPSLLSLPTPPIGLGLGLGGPAFNNNGPGNNPDFGKSGCVVSMENVPYRAGVDDILDFFKGFLLDKQNIMRRYNDNGTPTGDARVCFGSPSEAKRAMEIKKYGKIFNRTIYLKLLDDM